MQREHMAELHRTLASIHTQVLQTSRKKNEVARRPTNQNPATIPSILKLVISSYRDMSRGVKTNRLYTGMNHTV